MPVNLKPHNLPLHYEEAMKQELAELLRLGIIEPPDSPYSFPIAAAKKWDTTHRMCIDLRKLK